MVVRDCLKAGRVVVGPDTPASQAWALMQQHQIHHLPVVNEQQQLVGVVAERDVWRALSMRQSNGRECEVLRLMMLAPRSVAGNVSIEDALALLWRNGDLDALPVVTEGRLEGVVTRDDLLRALSEMPERRTARPLVPATVWDQEAPDMSAFLG